MLRTCLATFLVSCTLSSAWLLWRNDTDRHSIAYNLACSKAIHGKLSDGECMDYATALSVKLSAAGIHGRLIFYHWTVKSLPPGDPRATGAHVFVQYDDADGRYIVDNEHDRPIPVSTNMSIDDEIFTLAGSNPNVDITLIDSMNRLSIF